MKKSMKHFEISRWANISESDWNNWHWQMRNAIKDIHTLNSIIGDIVDYRILEDDKFKDVVDTFEFKITPYTLYNFVRCIKEIGIAQSLPILNTFLPMVEEIANKDLDLIDGIGEDRNEVHPTQLITKFYPDRALFCLNYMCASYCRFCVRRRKIGDGEMVLNRTEIKNSLEYLRKDTSIKDVILSGGDPLIYGDEVLDEILNEIKNIKHIKVLRIDTKMPNVVPQRITDSLIKVLKKYQPLYLVINFIHPLEVSTEVKEVCKRLSDEGIILASHTPLLKGLNDDVVTIKELMTKLIEIRVRPYYLIQFIPNKWNEHFRVPIQKGIDIIKSLQGHITGLANPTFIVYLPDSGGKVIVSSDSLLKKTSEGYLFTNFQGREILYPEPLD